MKNSSNIIVFYSAMDLLDMVDTAFRQLGRGDLGTRIDMSDKLGMRSLDMFDRGKRSICLKEPVRQGQTQEKFSI